MMEKLLNKLPIALLLVQMILMGLLVNEPVNQSIVVMMGMISAFMTASWVVWESFKKAKEHYNGNN
jgi:putative flippase GtrA